MDEGTARTRLPRPYAEALRLRDAGLDAAAIAVRMGVPPESVGPLLRLAEAKLARWLDGDG